MKDTDYVIIVRLSDFRKTWAAWKFGDSNPIQTNLKGPDDDMILKSCDVSKIPVKVRKDYVHQIWIEEDSEPLILLDWSEGYWLHQHVEIMWYSWYVMIKYGNELWSPNMGNRSTLRLLFKNKSEIKWLWCSLIN